jgi:hypothetical protein
MRIGEGIDLVQISRPIYRVAVGAGIVAEPPALVGHRRLDDRDGNDVLQSFELAGDQDARRPRAAKCSVEMVAIRFGAKATPPGRPGGAVGRDPVAEARDLPDEAALGVGGLDRPPSLRPFAVDEHRPHS